MGQAVGDAAVECGPGRSGGVSRCPRPGKYRRGRGRDEFGRPGPAGAEKPRSPGIRAEPRVVPAGSELVPSSSTC